MFASSGNLWDTAIIQYLMRVGFVLSVVVICLICFIVWRCTKNDPHKRRWYQFSLKTLLIVMTLFVVGVACVKIVFDLLGVKFAI